MFSLFVIEIAPMMSPANVENVLGVAGLSFTTFLIFKAVFFVAEATQQVSCFASCGCNFRHLHLQFSEFLFFLYCFYAFVTFAPLPCAHFVQLQNSCLFSTTIQYFVMENVKKLNSRT